jgi:diguanylate cyclase (GGDEF)-like protein
MSMLSRFLSLTAGWRAVRLSVRLALGFGALTTLMLLVVLLAMMRFGELAQYSTQMMERDVQRLRQHADGHGNAMARLLTAPRVDREAIYPLIDADNARIEQLFDALSNTLGDAVSVQLLAQLASRQRQYRELFSEVVVWIESDEVARAREKFNDAAQPALRELLDTADQLFGREQTMLRQHQADMQETIRTAQLSLGVLTAGALALAVFLAWSTAASVARPLAQVEQAARRIAGGDYTARVSIPSRDELGNVAQAMNAMAAAVAARESEIEHLAYVDPLTDLPNRNGLRQNARKLAPRRMGLILMDVARLRTVNEVLGFETGDILLAQIADVLRTSVAAQGHEGSIRVLGRVAGGVFVLLCVDLDRAAMEREIERIDHALADPLGSDSQVVDAQLVYGLTDGQDTSALPFDALLQQAELAVGDAKRRKHAWAWHVPVNAQARAGQLSLLSSLRGAAISGELEMWLQPKQCLRTGAVLGMEALVRWRHPQRGFVSPAEFIPFAERTGHISVVTDTMLDAALRLLADWQRDRPAMCIAVNVSAHDVQDANFANKVAQLARLHKAPLKCLRLEITESSLMDDADGAMPVLNALRDMGVRLSIDDFGTGYSSLAYLRKLPVDELKIDRSFVARADLDPDAQALLRTIIELGHSLNMQVTAEGIEREQERDLLKGLDCDQAQGYLIARPMALQAARAYVAALPP